MFSSNTKKLSKDQCPKGRSSVYKAAEQGILSKVGHTDALFLLSLHLYAISYTSMLQKLLHLFDTFLLFHITQKCIASYQPKIDLIKSFQNIWGLSCLSFAAALLYIGSQLCGYIEPTIKHCQKGLYSIALRHPFSVCASSSGCCIT